MIEKYLLIFAYYLLGGIMLTMTAWDWKKVNVKKPEHIFPIVFFAIMWIPIIFFIATAMLLKKIEKICESFRKRK